MTGRELALTAVPIVVIGLAIAGVLLRPAVEAPAEPSFTERWHDRVAVPLADAPYWLDTELGRVPPQRLPWPIPVKTERILPP